MHPQTKLNKQRNQRKREQQTQTKLANAVERVAKPIIKAYHERMDILVAALQKKSI